jgi:hypothetical protein
LSGAQPVPARWQYAYLAQSVIPGRPASVRAVNPRWVRGHGLLAFAAAVVALELVLAATQMIPLARIGLANHRAPSRLVRDADLDPFASFGPTQVVTAAQQVIPRNATYAIRVGQSPPGAATALVEDILRFWLLPRRYTTNLADAQWVIAYHHPSETLGVRYSAEIGLGPDANAVKVSR